MENRKEAEQMRSGVEEDKVKMLLLCYPGMCYYDLYSYAIFNSSLYSFFFSCFLVSISALFLFFCSLPSFPFPI